MIQLNGNDLTLEDFIKIARFNEKVALTDAAIESVKKSRETVNYMIENNQIRYGISTGFGQLADVTIDKENLGLLQENLIKSHACGVGPIFSEEVARGMLVLRINALLKGCSGIRLETVEKMVEYLNNGVTPAIPEQGSLGASGDLAPLSHMALPLIGLGHILEDGQAVPTMEYLNKKGIKPLDGLHAKEGLSLINGTQAMTSVGAIALWDAQKLAKLADVSASLTMEALFGITDAFDKRVHEIRPHAGQIKTAQNILTITNGSKMLTRQGEIRTQDAYSIRCIPQIHGASKDALEYIAGRVDIEINATTDNPLVFGDDVISAGNFHGQPMALPFDFMKMAVAELANVSERRIERLVNSALSGGLPAFLVKNPGVNSGFMIMQYSAASLVSENKVLAHPACVDSIPSSGNQEDHVSMGTISARGAKQILDNAYNVLAIEFLSAIQAIDLRENKGLGKGTSIAYKMLREHLPFIENDEIMYPLIEKCCELIKEDKFINEIEKVLGKL